MIAITDDFVVSEGFLDRIDTIKKDYGSNNYCVCLKNRNREFEFQGLSEEHGKALIKIIKERNKS